MKVKVQDRQSLVDIALQTSGGMEAAMALAIGHDIPVSEPLAPEAVLETVAAIDRLVLGKYQARDVRPATELSPADLEAMPYGGIELMGIEMDFIVS